MRLFGRMGVGAQIRLIFVFAALSIFLVVGVSVHVFGIYEDFRRDLAEVEVPLLKEISQVNDALVSIQQDLARLVDRARRRVVTAADVAREGKSLLARFDGAAKRLPGPPAGGEWERLVPLLAQLDEVVAAYRDNLVLAVQKLPVDPGLAEIYTQRVAADALSVNRASALLQEEIDVHLVDDLDDLRSSLNKVVLPIILAALFATLVFLFLLYRLSSNVRQIFSHVHRTLLRLSEGDVQPLAPPALVNRESEEIALSLETFRKTLTDLGDLRTCLEAEVADRTERLTQTNAALSGQIARLHATQRELHLFKRVFESTAEAIVITDLTGAILDVNDAYVAVTGYRLEDVLGLNPRLTKSGLHDADFYQAMWRTILGEGRWTGEIWDKRRNGEVYPKLLSINTVYDDTQQPTHYVGVFTDISDMKAVEAQLEQMAYFDRLTGLPNRRLLLDRLAHAISLSQRNGSAGAVFFLDLDKFKSINDTLGHQIGDELLIEVARRLKECVRESDTVGRLAGDEFLVLVEALPGDAAQTARYAATVAEKIASALGRPYWLGETAVHTSSSVGVVLFDGAYAGDVDGLITKADTAMYEAKKAGRGVVRFFDPAMQEALEGRVQLENLLRTALRHAGFELYLQPQLDGDLRVAGVEALIRLHCDDGSLLSPAQFITVAEEIHLIQDIERWVMAECCRILRCWAEDPVLGAVPVSLNVSGQHFDDRQFVAETGEALSMHGIGPERLKLELTESVVVSDLAESTAKIRALQASGIRLAMDDFGTGYSSLSYLCRLPFNEIKLDRSFVSSMMGNQNDMFIVHSVLTMARLLKAEVVAEGVETVEQLGALDTLGCQKFQGYLFARPMPVDACAQWIRQHDPEAMRQRLICREGPAS